MTTAGPGAAARLRGTARPDRGPPRRAESSPGRLLTGLALVCLASTQPGCSTLDYYGQAVSGHLSLMASRRSIADLLSDADADRALQSRLQQVIAVRDFASQELGLPDNRSYRSYVALDRPYVVWNVVAAPEFSLTPKEWCFPVAGCVSYRGYFSRQSAEVFAAGLREAGFDVMVAGASAYSTLGWFDDPVLSTMLAQPDHYLVGIIFHELAHQLVYVADDTPFNEAFAVTVEQHGVRRWYEARGMTERRRAFEDALLRQDVFLSLVSAARSRLEALYLGRPGNEPARAAEMRLRKQRILDELRLAYQSDKSRIGSGYEQWFNRDLNNAKLALVATYHGKVRAFEALLARHDADLGAFYEAVRELAALSSLERERRLLALAAK